MSSQVIVYLFWISLKTYLIFRSSKLFKIFYFHNLQDSGEHTVWLPYEVVGICKVIRCNVWKLCVQPVWIYLKKMKLQSRSSEYFFTQETLRASLEACLNQNRRDQAVWLGNVQAANSRHFFRRPFFRIISLNKLLKLSFQMKEGKMDFCMLHFFELFNGFWRNRHVKQMQSTTVTSYVSRTQSETPVLCSSHFKNVVGITEFRFFLPSLKIDSIMRTNNKRKYYHANNSVFWVFWMRDLVAIQGWLSLKVGVSNVCACAYMCTYPILQIEKYKELHESWISSTSICRLSIQQV